MKALILDFSGSCHSENLPVVTGGEVLSFRDIDGTNCYCDDESAIAIANRLANEEVPLVRWIDTGDYHYLSKILSDRISGNFALLLFDRHPDMQSPAFGDVLSCGGWVRVMLEKNPLLKIAFIVGSDPELRSETEGFGGRVRLYDEDGVSGDGIRLADEVKATGYDLYISIDRDVLDQRFARTDWNQGTMDFGKLLELVDESVEATTSRGHSVVGIDICGSITEGKGGRDEDFDINAGTSAKLYGFLTNLLEKQKC